MAHSLSLSISAWPRSLSLAVFTYGASMLLFFQAPVDRGDSTGSISLHLLPVFAAIFAMALSERGRTHLEMIRSSLLLLARVLIVRYDEI